MSLQSDLMAAMKVAMKEKNQIALQALRAIKSEILLAQTSGSTSGLSEADEIKILSKLVKQRKDSAEIFTEQNRADLAEPELQQAEVIAKFLPEQMSEDEVRSVVQRIISQIGATGMKDMGKVMGMANKELAGKTDGKTIASLVKSKLS